MSSLSALSSFTSEGRTTTTTATVSSSSAAVSAVASLESLALENFYSHYNHQDDPFKGRWECLYAGIDCNTVAFDWQGAYLAIGTAEGYIHLWSIVPMQRRIGKLRLPSYTLRPSVSSHTTTSTDTLSSSVSSASSSSSSSTYLPPYGTPLNSSILTLAWSVTSRLLYVSTVSGYIVVIDTERLTILKTILSPDYVNFVPRFIKVHPFVSSPYRSLLLIIPWYGMPMLLDWYNELWIPFAQTLLPPPAMNRIRMSLAQKGSLPLQTDACWDTHQGTDGKSIYIVTTRGALMQIRLSCFETDTSPLTTNDTYPPSPPSSSSSSSYRIYRLNYIHTAPVLQPPEIHSSRSYPYVMITTTRGILLFDNTTLTSIDLKYNEPVDNTKLITARLSTDDKYIYALPHAHSGHMSGGVYAFRRGFVGDIRLKRGPRGGVRFLDCHPTRGILVGITSRGAVYLLRQSLFTHWPGPMYPPGFTLFLQNREYTEAEDEYDLILENGKFTFRPVKIPDSSQPVHIGSKGEGSSNNPSSLQHTHHFAQLQQVMQGSAMDLEPIDSVSPSTLTFPLNYLTHGKHVHDILDTLRLPRDQNLIGQHTIRATEQEYERNRTQAQQHKGNNGETLTVTPTNTATTVGTGGGGGGPGVEEEDETTTGPSTKKSKTGKGNKTGTTNGKGNTPVVATTTTTTSIEDSTVTPTNTGTNNTSITVSSNPNDMMVTLLNDQPVALGLETLNQTVIFDGEPVLNATILQSLPSNNGSPGTETSSSSSSSSSSSLGTVNEQVLSTWNLFLQDWRKTMGIGQSSTGKQSSHNHPSSVVADIFLPSSVEGGKDTETIYTTTTNPSNPTTNHRNSNPTGGNSVLTYCVPIVGNHKGSLTVSSLSPSGNYLSTEFLYHFPTQIDPPNQQEKEERLYRDQRRMYSELLRTVLFGTTTEESKDNTVPTPFVTNEQDATISSSLPSSSALSSGTVSSSTLSSLMVPSQLVRTIENYELPYIDNRVLANANLPEKVYEQMRNALLITTVSVPETRINVPDDEGKTKDTQNTETKEKDEDPVERAIHSHNQLTSKRAQIGNDLTKAILARKRQAETVAVRIQQQQQKLREHEIHRQQFLLQQQQQRQQFLMMQQQRLLMQQRQQQPQQEPMYNTNTNHPSHEGNVPYPYPPNNHPSAYDGSVSVPYDNIPPTINTGNPNVPIYPQIPRGVSPTHRTLVPFSSSNVSVSPHYHQQQQQQQQQSYSSYPPGYYSSSSSSSAYDNDGSSYANHQPLPGSFHYDPTTTTTASTTTMTMNHPHNGTMSTDPNAYYASSASTSAASVPYSPGTHSYGGTNTLMSLSSSSLSVPLPHSNSICKRKVTDEMRAKIVELRLQGVPRKEVAAMFGVSVTTVGDAFRAVRGYRNRLRKSMMMDAQDVSNGNSSSTTNNQRYTNNEGDDDDDEEEDD